MPNPTTRTSPPNPQCAVCGHPASDHGEPCLCWISGCSCEGFQNDQITTALLDTFRALLPLAEAYLRNAPGHPDNAILEDARAILVSAKEKNRA